MDALAMIDGHDIETLRQILATSNTIAVVGLSADWYRPSFFAAKYMLEHGYRIIPVNPKYPSILGQRCYASLADLDEPVDIVDVRAGFTLQSGVSVTGFASNLFNEIYNAEFSPGGFVFRARPRRYGFEVGYKF